MMRFIWREEQVSLTEQMGKKVGWQEEVVIGRDSKGIKDGLK